LLTGRTITGQEADGLGLARACDDPVETALSWAREIATFSSPTSVAMMKKQLLKTDGLALGEAVSASLEAMAEAFAWPDLGEALAARSEKRSPNFPNRSAGR
jgi:enoyl-CoA hydratase/carnithine racemase